MRSLACAAPVFFKKNCSKEMEKVKEEVPIPALETDPAVPSTPQPSDRVVAAEIEDIVRAGPSLTGQIPAGFFFLCL